MNMEFLYANFANTTTQFAGSSNTAGSAFLFDRRPTRRYISSGFADDLTQTTIKINFDTTQTVSRVILQNVNFKDFRIYYGGVTANTLALTSTSETVTSVWTSNSSTNLYLMFSDTYMTSLSIDIKKTMVANEEKKIGQLWISDQRYQFTRNPNKSGFSPDAKTKEIKHEMSDGGTVVFRIRDKFKYSIKTDYRDNAEISALQDIYDANIQFAFVPFPTGTAWDGRIYEMNWTGGFQAGLRPSSDWTAKGYDVEIMLEETPS